MDHYEMQLVGGGLYLLNKLFLAVMEYYRGRNETRFWLWKKWAWGLYILGLPFMVWFLYTQTSLIFAAIELGGLPAMLCGFVNAFRRKNAPQWLEWLAVLAVPVGFVASIKAVGGFGAPNQILEVIGSTTFLAGTYLIYKEKLGGYSWFMAMNMATGILFWRTDRLVLAMFQAASVPCIAFAYAFRRTQSSGLA